MSRTWRTGLRVARFPQSRNTLRQGGKTNQSWAWPSWSLSRSPTLSHPCLLHTLLDQRVSRQTGRRIVPVHIGSFVGNGRMLAAALNPWADCLLARTCSRGNNGYLNTWISWRPKPKTHQRGSAHLQENLLGAKDKGFLVWGIFFSGLGCFILVPLGWVDRT